MNRPMLSPPPAPVGFTPVRRNAQFDGWRRQQYCLTGIVSVLLMTVLAIMSVPANPEPAGAMRLSGVFMTFGLLAAPVISMLNDRRNVLRAENVAASALAYWVMLDLIQGAYPLENIDKGTAQLAILCVGVFVSALWLGCLPSPVSPPKSLLRIAAVNVPAPVIFFVILIFFTLCMLNFAIPCNFDPVLMVNALNRARFDVPWAATHEGGWASFLHHLVYFGYLLPALTVVLWNRRERLTPEVLISAVCSIVTLMFVGHGGGRRIIGVMILSAIATWLLSRKKIAARHLVMTGIMMFSLLLFMQFMLFIRSEGFQKDGFKALLQARDSIMGETRGAYDHLHVDDNFFRLCQLIDFIPRRHPYVYYEYIYWVAVRPIPRVVWEGKPLNGGFDLAEETNSQASLSSSIVGELYLSWGIGAVFFGGLIYGRLATLPTAFLKTGRLTMGPLIYGYLTMILLVGSRSMIEVVLFSYSILAVMLFSPLFKRRKAR